VVEMVVVAIAVAVTAGGGLIMSKKAE